MTAQEKRQSVMDQYAKIIGRNLYSQPLRNYCYKQYKDGHYYSDCSSSICYAYEEAGYGFGILNTAGIYRSGKLTTVDADITDGIPDLSKLRSGDMLEFAGSDISRPLKIGHVEMYFGNGTLCGHGSGYPSYKDLQSYCKSRYSQWAHGGWRKGLVCVRRCIQDDTNPNRSGWHQDSEGWHYYLGNTGDCIRNDWHHDPDGRWYWFNGAGVMVTSTWYCYKEEWYYLGSDGAMAKGLQSIDGTWYYLDQDGRMATEPVLLTPDQNGALQYPGLTKS